ncbi:MAG: DUF6788 family protein [Acidimicrobiales bacterium]
MATTGPTAAERRRQTALARRLDDAGFVLPGSLITRHMRCGKANCRCHGEPAELHGPYLQWTRTAEGKTLTRLLPDPVADRYRGWFDNARRLRETVSELEALSIAIVERDRQARR